MPLYEYLCPSCDKTVEVLVRSQSEQPECPECGSKKIQKQLSVAAAPAIAGSTSSSEAPTCGRGECQSGCMFD